MISYLARSIGALARAGKSLFVLGVLGVALGVASVLSIQIINRNALAAFEGSLRAVSGDVDLSVLGTGPDLEETLFTRVLADPGVAAAWPMQRLTVAVAGQPSLYLDIVGLDLFAPMELPWAVSPADAAAPLTIPGWAAVTPQLAERLELEQGGAFRVSSGSSYADLVVGALVDFRKLTPLAGARLVVMDLAQSQALFGGRGRLTQVDLRLRPGAAADTVAARLGDALGPSVRIVTPEQRRRTAAGLLGAFRLNLTALSLVSLFVGAFLVYTSTQAGLVRRRAEFGLLRSLGATRAQVLGLILFEALLLGTLGTAVGLPLGYAAAAWNVERISGTLTNLYLLQEIETLQLPFWLTVLGATIGIGGALAGAIVPAWETSRHETRALLAAYDLHRRVRARAGWLALLGLGLILATIGVWWFLAREWRAAGFLVGVGLLIGLPLTTPWTVRLATGGIGIRGFGLIYGIRSLGQRLHHAAFAVAALAVAVSLLLSLTTMIGSFRRTVEIWIGSTLRADIYVTTESWRRARTSAVLEDSLVAELGALPEVARMDRLRQFFVQDGGRRISVVGIDMRLGGGERRFSFLAGDPVEALRAAAEHGAVIISEPLARKLRLGVGDRLTLPGPRGRLSFPIAGVTYDYSNESGGAAMDLQTMARLFGPGPINNVALYLRDGVEVRGVVDRLRAEYEGTPLHIRSNADLREEVFAIFDQTFAVTRMAQGMCLLIAVCGITLTLLILTRERIAELALYRALGARRRQIFRVFVGQGLGIGLLASLLGAAGGALLALVLIFLINRAYFGWTIAVHWPWASLAGQLLTILAAAVTASLYPAIRASRTPATELTRENL